MIRQAACVVQWLLLFGGGSYTLLWIGDALPTGWLRYWITFGALAAFVGGVHYVAFTQGVGR